MTTLFISYSRKDIDFAQKFSSTLNDIGFESWVDWNDIPPTADWWDQIAKGIESADAFLFLLSPDSTSSEVCRREIDHALKNGKRMIPIVVRDVAPSEVHTALTSLNWIFFRKQDDFNNSIQKLEVGLKTDLAWVETQRRLQVRALEWEKRKDGSLLLRGKDLQDAELQISANASKDPAPTVLQREYILQSRLSADRQRRFITGISIAGAIAMTALAIFGFIQASRATAQATIAEGALAQAEIERANAQQSQAEAEQQAERALAGGLAAQASSIKANDHALAVLLGLEAYQREDSLLTRSTLFDALQFSPYTRLFGYNGPVTAVAVSPNGNIAASTSCKEYSDTQCKYGVITLSDALTKQPLAKLEGQFGIVNTLVFHQYEKTLLLAAGGCVPVDESNKGCTDRKGQIVLWDVTDLKNPVQLSDTRNVHTGLVKTLAFYPDGSLLASGSFDTTILLWNISDPAKPFLADAPLTEHSSFVNSLAFSADGGALISAGDDKRILIWKFDYKKNNAPAILYISDIKDHTAQVNSIAFSADGRRLVSASDDNSVILWDWDAAAYALKNPVKLLGHLGYVKSAAFNADGTIVASAGFDFKVILWNTKTGAQIGLPLGVHTKVINAVGFGSVKSADGADLPYLLSASDDRTVIQWDLSTRQPLSQPLKDVQPPAGVGVSAASGDLRASVIDTQLIKLTGRDEPLSGHTGAINSLSFSPKITDRILLASASDDQTVILWDVSDVANPSVFLKIESFSDPVGAAYFEGGQLVTIEKNGRAVQWDIVLENWIAFGCNAVKRNLTQPEWDRYLTNQSYRKTCESNP